MSRIDPAKVPKQPAKRKTRGFGFDPTESPYHFVLKRRVDGGITIVERFVHGDESVLGEGGTSVPVEVEKARLSGYLWERVAETAAAEFNDRLLADGARSARWLIDETPLAPHLGKELTLLAWAVEDADPTLVPTMLANWRGLAPEERWWFYTTINATSSHAEHGKDRGWRKAIKIAFADNPVHVPPSALLVGPMPIRESSERRQRAATPSATTEATQGTLRLFNPEG